MLFLSQLIVGYWLMANLATATVIYGTFLPKN